MSYVVLTMGGLLLCAALLGWEFGYAYGKRRALALPRTPQRRLRLKRPDDGGRP